jgi:hypothetical protein
MPILLLIVIVNKRGINLLKILKNKSINFNISWFHEFESTWSKIEKICYANSITAYETIKNTAISNSLEILDFTCCSQPCSKLQLLDINNTPDKQLKKMLNGINLNFNLLFKDYFCFCEDCLQYQFHSVLHQLTLFDNCPYHSKRLTKNCPNCFRVILYKVKSIYNGCYCGWNPFKNTRFGDYTEVVTKWLYPNILQLMTHFIKIGFLEILNNLTTLLLRKLVIQNY